MVQIGTPEQYFGEDVRYRGKKVLVGEPIEVRRIVEPVTYIQDSVDNTPLILGVCFFGTICFLAFLVWMTK